MPQHEPKRGYPANDTTTCDSNQGNFDLLGRSLGFEADHIRRDAPFSFSESRSTEAALLLRFEPLDKPVALPKLHCLAVDNLLRKPPRLDLVFANDIDPVDDMAVLTCL
jgi:hypothetical protein